MPMSRVETVMRYTSVAAALGLALLSLSTSLAGQKPEPQVDARSIQLLERGQAARAAGNLAGANDLLESALVVDPRNRAAYLALAEIARAQGLQGKAIRFYREALALQPTDLAALKGQGEAMVAKGAVARAKENLAKIRQLCSGACAEGAQLAAVIAKGPPPQAVAAATAEPPKTVGEN
jgi:Tfp pilus assembly protein PilF